MIAFPALKIGLLLIRQISKPIANYVKEQAKTHETLRKYIIGFAQSYHSLEIRLKRRQAGVERPEPAIVPLNDQRAIELASNFIGECIIFSTAALAVTVEFYRKRVEDSEKKLIEQEKQKNLESKLDEMQTRIEILEYKLKKDEDKQKNSLFQIVDGIFSKQSTQ